MTDRTLWGCRPAPKPYPDDWASFALGAQLGEDGGAASVFEVAGVYKPPLVAKIFNEGYRARVRTDMHLAHRLIHLAYNRGFLEEHPVWKVPFALWPRRVLFDVKEPSPEVQEQHVIGFTMAKLTATTSLHLLTLRQRYRARLSPDNTVDVASLLANQVAHLHRHPWKFVFTDMSNNNIHVSHDFSKVYFIDTDSLQFDEGAKFLPGGITPRFTSPGCRNVFNARGRLTASHDDFVLAIHIFMLLMADRGALAAHPFVCAGQDPDDLIDARQYPYAAPQRYALSEHAVTTYATLPSDIREAFTRTFTAIAPIPAEQWPVILARNRRFLCPRP